MKTKILALLLCATPLLYGCGSDEVGDVSLGLFTMKDVSTITNSITE
ncbi:hypothetical protein [Vibrio cidicii]|nr:hypothetical protein [Vibrio cidicii]